MVGPEQKSVVIMKVVGYRLPKACEWKWEVLAWTFSTAEVGPLLDEQRQFTACDKDEDRQQNSMPSLIEV